MKNKSFISINCNAHRTKKKFLCVLLLEIKYFNSEKKQFELIPNLTFLPMKVVKSSTLQEQAIPLTIPKFVDTNGQELGCGPVKRSTYKASFSAPMLVLIELMNKKTKAVKSGIETVKDGLINIGHGMCSGLFTFHDNSEYSVRFKYINLVGTESQFTKSIDFVVPVISEKLAR